MRSNLMCMKCGSRDIQEKLEIDPRTNTYKPVLDKPQPAPPWEFTHLDFQPHGGSVVADMANAKLAEWLGESRKVFGYLTTDEFEEGKVHKTPWHVLEHFNEKNTHTALLINIQPIVRETALDLLRQLLDAGKLGALEHRARKLLGEK